MKITIEVENYDWYRVIINDGYCVMQFGDSSETHYPNIMEGKSNLCKEVISKIIDHCMELRKVVPDTEK